jgi:phage gp29-like protein
MKELLKQIKIEKYSDYFGFQLPNPDTVLRKTGKAINQMKDLTYDAHLWSAMQSRKSGILSLDWNIDKLEIKELLLRLDYENTSNSMLDAIFYGFSAFEIIWNEKIINRKKVIFPSELKSIDSSLINFDMDGNLKLNSNKLNPLKYLLIRNKPSSENPYGEALLTRCYWPIKFKNAGFGFWTSYMEKFGSPLVIGKYPRGTSNEEANKLLDHLTNLAEDSAIVSPEDFDLEIKDANNYGTTAMYSEMIDKCNAEISKAILSQTLTSEVTTGSKAAAETHMKIRAEIIESDSRLLESAWQQLINKIWEVNYNTEIPKFRIDRSEIESTRKLDRDSRLVNECGLKFSNKYWLRNYNINKEELVD